MPKSRIAVSIEHILVWSWQKRGSGNFRYPKSISSGLMDDERRDCKHKVWRLATACRETGSQWHETICSSLTSFSSRNGEIGKAVLESALPQNTNVYGVLINEVQDITVVEQLITFVKYVNGSGVAKTVFRGTKTLDSCQGPNAKSITEKLLELLADCKRPTNHMSSFVTDGALVMTRKNSCAAARLKNLEPTLISFHCICHKLVLANSDVDLSLKPVKDIITNLKTAWKFFENILNAQPASSICWKNYTN